MRELCAIVFYIHILNAPLGHLKPVGHLHWNKISNHSFRRRDFDRGWEKVANEIRYDSGVAGGREVGVYSPTHDLFLIKECGGYLSSSYL